MNRNVLLYSFLWLNNEDTTDCFSRIASMKYRDCFRANEAWKKCMSVMYRGSQDVIKKEIFLLHISIYVRVLSSVDLSFGVVETNFNTFLKLVI